MRKFLKAVVLTIAVLPFAASAATGSIAGSKHDLSSTGGSSIRATTQTQLCIFCHTPHHALKQALIWNHVAAAADTFSAGTTTAGTSLASTQLLGPTLACLACHDGS